MIMVKFYELYDVWAPSIHRMFGLNYTMHGVRSNKS